jgi:probable addiction module antidote protein
MKTRTGLFETSSYLDTEESIAAYLNEIMQENDADLFLAAIGNIAKARGMAQVAAATGLGRESLYKAFAPGAKPRYDTIFRVIQALGIRFSAK